MSEAVDPSARPFELELDGGYRLRLADPSMIEAFERIRRMSDTRMPFLITGMTGVGKELAARAVHHYSGRTGPLVCINCAGLPDALIESELFGYEQGAFTGAQTTRPGLFEVARKGTVFLDEVGELPLHSQGALLRALDGHPVHRVGGRTQISFDTRIVAATNCDMEFAVASGRFRSDLFHRLRGSRLHIPPLRERPADIRLLAGDMFDAARDEASLERVRITDEAMHLLLRHQWPGNVRELRYAMMLAAIVCRGDALEVSHLPDDICRAPGAQSLSDGSEEDAESPGFFHAGYQLSAELQAIERKRIVQALDATEGVQSRAARLLGMPRRTLVRKLKEHRLSAAVGDTSTH